MKLRRLVFKFFALFVLSAGAFFVLSIQDVKADGTFCVTGRTWCGADCMDQLAIDSNQGRYNRCIASCNTNQQACFSAHAWISAWESWLMQVNLNIGDNFLILNEPNPICAYYPDQLVSCGSLETAIDVEVCMLMVMQEQAHNNCPQ